VLISLSILARSLLTEAFSRKPRKFLWKLMLPPFAQFLISQLFLCHASTAQ
jgi:hypothetical protein